MKIILIQIKLIWNKYNLKYLHFSIKMNLLESLSIKLKILLTLLKQLELHKLQKKQYKKYSMLFLKLNTILKELGISNIKLLLTKLRLISRNILLKKLKIIKKPMHLLPNLQVTKQQMLLTKPYQKLRVISNQSQTPLSQSSNKLSLKNHYINKHPRNEQILDIIIKELYE